MRRLIVVCLVATLSAWAACASVRADGPTVYINEMAVVTLKASVGSSSPIARARVLAAKLAKRDDLGLTVSNLTDGSKIFSVGELIILVNKDEAAKAGLSMSSLAARWVKAMQEAWALPPVEVNRDTVSILVAKSELLTVLGSRARNAPLYVSNPEVVSVNRKGGTIEIGGRAIGEAMLTIGDGEWARRVTLRVLPRAAEFPQTVSASVVGTPAAASTVEGALSTALKTKLATAANSRIVFELPKVGDLPAAERRTYTVKVTVTAPDAFPAEGTVTVGVANLGMALRRENELWYCNEPENVPGPRTLFLGDLRRDDPVRMLYHHINVSAMPLYFRVLAVNDSDLPANLVLIPGDSKDKNPVLAGVRAADPFFRSWLTGSAEVVTLPPHTSIPIAFRRLAPQETSSGLCYLRLLPGGPSNVLVNAEAVAAYPLDPTWQAATMTPTPYRETGPVAEGPKFAASFSNLVFPKPFKQEEFTYRAGGPFGFFRVGQKPIERRDPGKPLDGNFGVIYDVRAIAVNPTAVPVDIELVYETSAGYSGGLFSVDGEVVRLPLMQSKAEAKLAVFTLQPGESKTINVMTIPLSGSSYPVTLTLRPKDKGI